MARYYKEIAELLERERIFGEAIEYYIKVSLQDSIPFYSFLIFFCSFFFGSFLLLL